MRRRTGHREITSSVAGWQNSDEFGNLDLVRRGFDERTGCVGFFSFYFFLILPVARIEESWDKQGLIGQCGLGCFMVEERLSMVVILDCSFDYARPLVDFDMK